MGETVFRWLLFRCVPLVMQSTPVQEGDDLLRIFLPRGSGGCDRAPIRRPSGFSHCAYADDDWGGEVGGGERGERTLSARSSLLWISLSHSSRQEVDNMEQRTKKLHKGSILGNANYSVKEGRGGYKYDYKIS